MTWIALDIGGANLKAADGVGQVAALPFALWKEPHQLAAAVRALISRLPPAEQLAVTMTGELCDCFASKTDGVRHILSATQEVICGDDLWIYLVDGRFVRPEVAAELPMLAAASNWHALARLAGRYVADVESALLIDVGSTTCDVIPLRRGVPAAIGRTDTTRMLHGELVYTGVERSPCCAVLSEVSYRGLRCQVAQEFFATMKDVYVLLGHLAEDAADCDTADNRPSVREHAIRRLGKLLCADEFEFTAEDALQVARELADQQAARLAAAIQKGVAKMPAQIAEKIVLSGHGEFLARSALRKLAIERPVVSLSAELGPVISRCAPAHAVAILAREQLP